MKNRIACIALGLFLAWTGLPFFQHAVYMSLIVAGFFLGYKVGH